MSTRQCGNRKENIVIDILEQHGYRGYASRGSRGVDIVALAPPNTTLPHLEIECGAESKRVGEAFRKLAAIPAYSGAVRLVVRVLNRRGKRVVWWYAHADAMYTTDFIEALEAARAA